MDALTHLSTTEFNDKVKKIFEKRYNRQVGHSEIPPTWRPKEIVSEVEKMIEEDKIFGRK